MENIIKMFEGFTNIEPLSTESLELLNKIINIDNPMNFIDEFASQESIEKLEEELERLYAISNLSKNIRDILDILTPVKSNDTIFI